MATFVVAHGAWSAGWAWKKMRPLLRAKGHDLFTPTYTGLGERSHLAHKDINLETHIANVLGVLKYENLRNVILVGHSYGGMVATGVADRAPERIAHLVYVDAFAPRDGESLFDLQSAEHCKLVRESAQKEGDGWRIPPSPIPADTDQIDLPWLAGAPRHAAAENLRAEDQAHRRRRQAAAHLRLLQDFTPWRRLPAIPRPREYGEGLEMHRYRCEP